MPFNARRALNGNPNRVSIGQNAREWEGSQVSRTVTLRGGCQQGGAVLHAARSAAALYGCAVCGGSRGIAGARLAPRQPPLHPHAHALPSPSSPCAFRRLHRGNPPRATGALPTAGRCEPAQCARRPFLSRRAAWHQWVLQPESRCGAPRVPPCGHAGALRPLCSAPACPACSPIAQAHQPHRWGGTGALFGCTGRMCARARC